MHVLHPAAHLRSLKNSLRLQNSAIQKHQQLCYAYIHTCTYKRKRYGSKRNKLALYKCKSPRTVLVTPILMCNKDKITQEKSKSQPPFSPIPFSALEIKNSTYTFKLKTAMMSLCHQYRLAKNRKKTILKTQCLIMHFEPIKVLRSYPNQPSPHKASYLQCKVDVLAIKLKRHSHTQARHHCLGNHYTVLGTKHLGTAHSCASFRS